MQLYLEEIIGIQLLFRFTVRSQLLESKKNSRQYLLDWALAPVLADKLNLTDHLVLGAYNPLDSKYHLDPNGHPRSLSFC